MKTVITGLLIPFIGTAAGAACVFFLRKDLKRSVQRTLTGFAAGVMVAASIWSLIIFPYMVRDRSMSVTPPGIDLSDKYYIGFYQNETLIAVMDLIDKTLGSGTVKYILNKIYILITLLWGLTPMDGDVRRGVVDIVERITYGSFIQTFCRVWQKDGIQFSWKDAHGRS